jgi:hypothetical protein
VLLNNYVVKQQTEPSRKNENDPAIDLGKYSGKTKMTEIDAIEIAQLDAQFLQRKISKGAMPQEISNTLMALLKRRVHDMKEPRASREIESSSAEPPPPSSTFSEVLVNQATTLLMRTIRYLPPEDSRALFLWLINPTPAPGVLTFLVHTIGESSGVPALQTFQGQVNQILHKMKQTDEALFHQQLKTLNEARRNIIIGMLLDARWATQEGDGFSARNHIVRARKLALKWLQVHQDRQQTGWT